ncbi:MAG: transglycosylase SLT domain-containing protein [Minicystis sp.]
MLGRLLRASALLLGMTGATGSGCAPDLPPPPAQAPIFPQPPPPPIALPAPQAAPPPPPVSDPNAIDVAKIPLVLEDPRLAAVKAQADHEAYANAAQLLAAAIAGASPSAEERGAWLYQLGRLRALGGDPAGAAKAYEESAAAGYVLANHARLQAAQWLVGVGQFDAAIAEARLCADPALAGQIDLVLADAYLGKKDFNGAAKHFRAYLGRDKHPPQWVNVALRFANALLQHPSEAHAEEAVRLARRVAWEANGGQGAGEAADIEKKALDTLPSEKKKKIERLSSEEQLAKARGLLLAGQARPAVIATDRILKMPKAKGASEFACEVWLVRGEALVKMKNRKPEAADAYKGAIEHCEGQPRRADALFAGGRASASAGRHPEAVERFALLEKEFPRHRLADDARLRGARAALEANDEPAYVRMLERIADDYPEGDVSNDGLFELALRYMEQKAWAKAIPLLEKALARAPRERAYYAAGRLPYFLARAHAELGATEQAKGVLAAVIRDYPLSYYMALAHARLADRDREMAERALAESVARDAAEPVGSFPVARGPWFDEPGFARARELLRQGETKLGRAEMDRLGLGARTAPREVQYTAAFLFARGEDWRNAHGIFRAATITAKPLPTDLTDWLEHYPSGRWRAAWEVAYPRPWAPIVGPAARRQNVPEALAYAIMREESAFDPRVVSAAKAYGLMQLIVPTARKMGESLGLSPDEESLKQPAVNVPIGCHYLAVLRGQFPDNPLLAIPGYNAGGGAPKKWITERGADDFDLWVERIPYEETRNYTKRVIGTMAAYEMLYTRDQPSEALRAPLAASPSLRVAAAQAPSPSP